MTIKEVLKMRKDELDLSHDKNNNHDKSGFISELK